MLSIYCIEKGEKGGQKLHKRGGGKGLFLGLLLFVGIPLPGTGAWTGTLAASFLKLRVFPLQMGKRYDNMFLYVLIYCYGDFHAEKISDCISGIHGTFD